MFGLRKRAKLLDNKINNNSDNLKKDKLNDHFNELPIELYLYIIDFLPRKDKLKLRLLNTFFRNLIDKANYLWKDIVLNIHIDSKTDLKDIAEFIKCRRKIKYFNLTCPKSLTKKQIESQPKENKIINGNEIHIRITNLNIISVSCLNFFSFCKKLRIKSFVNPNGHFKIAKNFNYKNVELIKFNSLESLDISCLLYDEKTDEYFYWNNFINENQILTKKFILFENLVKLTLKYYTDSIYDLFKCILNLKNLSQILLEHCLPKEDKTLYELDEKFKNTKFKQRLKLTSFKFVNTKTIVPYLFLKYLTDLTKLIKLHLFIKMDILNDSNVSMLKDIYTEIDKMTNLKFFETNIYQKNFLPFMTNCLENKRNFFSNLNHLALTCTDYSTNRVVESNSDDNNYKFTLNDFKSVFHDIYLINLYFLSLFLTIDCSDYNLSFKYFKDFKNKFTPDLHTLNLRIRCLKEDCKKDLKKCNFSKIDLNYFVDCDIFSFFYRFE